MKPPYRPPPYSLPHPHPARLLDCHPPHPPPGFRGRVAGFLGRNWARVGYAVRVEPTWLEVNRFDLPVAGLGGPLRVAHLTDFHCGEQIPRGYLEDALARAQAARPDLIALTGDFVHKGYKHVAAAARLFRHLRAPLGVYAVLGNHDFSVRNALGIRRHPGLHRAIADALGAEGVRVLRNEAVELRRESGRVTVAGLNDLWSRECDPAAALADDPAVPRVVLAHNPQAVELFAGRRADLVLSGHTHGGQVDWPGVGRVLLGRKAKRWAAGLYPLPGGHVYVNKGVGFGWRFRFGVRPEVALFDLRPATEPEARP